LAGKIFLGSEKTASFLAGKNASFLAGKNGNENSSFPAVGHLAAADRHFAGDVTRRRLATPTPHRHFVGGDVGAESDGGHGAAVPVHESARIQVWIL
jgi:hypothetical protein